MKRWMMRGVLSVCVVCVAWMAAGCETKTKPSTPAKMSDNPKTRAGKMVKEAKDTRKKLEDRNEALGKEMEKTLGD